MGAPFLVNTGELFRDDTGLTVLDTAGEPLLDIIGDSSYVKISYTFLLAEGESLLVGEEPLEEGEILLVGETFRNEKVTFLEGEIFLNKGETFLDRMGDPFRVIVPHSSLLNVGELLRLNNCLV